MKLDRLNECLIYTVDTNGLVLQHQAISIHSADYIHICLQLFMG